MIDTAGNQTRPKLRRSHRGSGGPRSVDCQSEDSATRRPGPIGAYAPRGVTSAVFGLVLILAGCGSLPPHPDLPQTDRARTLDIVVDPETGLASTEISVLIYNVVGLPWPLANGKRSRQRDARGERIPIDGDRPKALRAIGDALGEMRSSGVAPHVIVLQEAFIGPAAEIPERGGYPNWVTGPGSNDLGEEYSDRATPEFIAERSFWKGEKLGKWQSSGLLVASDFPILRKHIYPFNQWECAGFDCFANKGALVVILELPGVPEPLAIATTHFNSQGASGVTRERALIAHNLQVDGVSEFLYSVDEPELPFIWGGDLNMRHADDRISYFVERSGGDLNEVSSFCIANPDWCEFEFPLDTDTPWYETQDLQGWASGPMVDVIPVRVKGLFDAPVDGVMPSDHDGLLVTYRLTWELSR